MLQSGPRLPRIPRDVLARHDVFVAADTPFTAVARLLQSVWREAAQLDAGTFKGRRLGSYLTEQDGLRGANFLSPEVATLVRRELHFLDRSARVDAGRLRQNLLTSQALCFNLFGPLKLNPPLADAFVRLIAPDVAATPTDLLFEHAAGRVGSEGAGDKTAFDAFIQCADGDGRRTFPAFEVKYSEHMRDDATTPRLRHDELAEASQVFRDPQAPALRKAPLQQLWREHLLALALRGSQGRYAAGRFIVIAPRLNAACWDAIETYAGHLVTDDPAVSAFQAVSLEECLAHLTTAGAAELAGALHARYTDFERLLSFV